MKTCKQCNSQFEITTAQQAFCKKIGVPEPTRCHECRQKRRLVWRNERVFYSRNCDKCKKPILSVYNPDSPYKVYCYDCWYGDSWDAKENGRDFNFSRPFFEQFNELLLSVPHLNLFQLDNVNSEFINYGGRCKNCYLSTAAWEVEDSYYSSWIMYSKDCVDCFMIFKSEICYESIDCDGCYGTYFSSNSIGCRDSYFLDSCANCSNCFGCKNLKNATYYIFNKKASKEEFETLVKQLRSYSELKKIKQKCREHFLKFPFRFAIMKNAQDCVGNYIINSKNCIKCFDISRGENLFGCSAIDNMKDGFDSDIQQDGELFYEIISGAGPYQTFFTVPAMNNKFVQYCFGSVGSENCFGCAALKKHKYCIFNKQFSKEEYEILRDRIITHMKETGEYGEFFPASISPFGYNETMVIQYYPADNNEAIKQGFKWQDKMPGKHGGETIASEQIADSIDDINDDFAKNILRCVDCSKNYKVIKQELLFLKKHGFPVPRNCPDCRYMARIMKRNPKKFWHRKCANCTNEFETTYSPDRPEKVYCEECYQKEVI